MAGTSLAAETGAPPPKNNQNQGTDGVTFAPNEKKKISVKAGRISSQTAVGKLFEKAVEIRQGGTTISTDQAFFNELSGDIDVSGNVRFLRPDFSAAGRKLVFNVDTVEGHIDDVRYRLGSEQFDENYQGTLGIGGKSSNLTFDSEQNLRLRNATFTTCRNIDNPDWYLQTDTLELDLANGRGYAETPSIYFKGIPLFGLPAMTFPLSNDRKSGLLTPTVGYSSNSGFQYSQPIYWNIAPNRDAIISPAYLSSRGWKLDSNFRYLQSETDGEFNYDYIYDQSMKEHRYRFVTGHQYSNKRGTRLGVEYNLVSDADYFKHFGNTALQSSERALPQTVYLEYQPSTLWNLKLQTHAYQFLQDPVNPTARPYNRPVQATANVQRQEGIGLEWQTRLQYTRFYQSDRAYVQDYNQAQGLNWNPQVAERTVFNPSLSLPLRGSFYLLEPRLSYHLTRYNISKGYDSGRGGLTGLGANSEIHNRVLPTLSVNAGLVFERDFSLWDQALVQTLEPTLFYVYTPFVKQSQLPNFDSALTNFDFVQLFSPNSYSGDDRISDANQVSTLVVSRFLSGESGVERGRLLIGQRTYFTQRILENTSRIYSDVIFAAQGHLSSSFSFSSSAQYSPEANSIFRASVEASLHPGRKKVLNLAYRLSAVDPYSPKTVESVEGSGQWPLTLLGRGWYGVFKTTYSLLDKKILGEVYGVEYNADCWTFRIATQKFASSGNTVSTNYFIQLDFSGWASIGLNPLSTLEQNVTNYEK